ncbi:MAG: bifunctional riboflavin kinase/FAD synthetase [Bryobacteraceae bacterium]|nr:bifunctional riboflavin kinase/FAD synthetase [Bryobacteraceae bacterium]
MRVFRSLDSIPQDAKSSALSIGNFDGVHEGHKALFRRNLEVARELGLTRSVLTFDPHPTTIVAPERAPRLLTTIEQRLSLMAEAGIEQAFVMPFDVAFSQLDPETFVRQVVVGGAGAKAVLVGDNFRFGAKQAGDVQILRDLGDRFGFRTEIVSVVPFRGVVVSSSAVRDRILAGNVSAACRLLGRAYALEGKVVSGHGIGSRQTVPTLNLQTTAEVLPLTGVYITRTADLDSESRLWPSITNVGYRPTFDGDALTIETFLLADLERTRSPERIRVAFLRRVRGEQKFESPEALRSQILLDVTRAKTWFRRVERFSSHRSTRMIV